MASAGRGNETDTERSILCQKGLCQLTLSCPQLDALSLLTQKSRFRAEQYKFYQKAGKPELYDSLANPFEKQNVASSHPEKTKELKK